MSSTLVLALGLLALLALAGWWLIYVNEGSYLGSWAVRLLYDRTADGYDALKDFDELDEFSFLGLPLYNRLEESVGPAGRVLDVATGTGRLPLALFDVPRFEGTIVGLDIAPRMLALAEEKLLPQIEASRMELIEHPAVPLPFEDASFDAVCMLETLEFLPDRTAALREMIRVLRPSGWLMLTNRIGWEARFMPGKSDWPEDFERRLKDLGMAGVETKPWQTYYDLVWGRKPAAG